MGGTPLVGIRLFNPRKKKRRGAGEWQPDLFGGRGIERPDAFAPGLSRAEQLELAREEMRATGSRDLFDFMADQPPRRNPRYVLRLDEDNYWRAWDTKHKRYSPHVLQIVRRKAFRQVKELNADAERPPERRWLEHNPRRVTYRQVVEAWDRGNRGRARQLAERVTDPAERRLAERFLESRRANPAELERNPRPSDYSRESAEQLRRRLYFWRPQIRAYRASGDPDEQLESMARTVERELARRRRSRRPNPADTPEMRYQRAIGHGERLATARKAAANPGRATGRMAPNCPMCGALVRLPNPIPPRVTCHNCGTPSLVRRP
jgi:hypothetical protein